MIGDRPILDLRGQRALPRLSLPWLSDPPSVRNRRAQHLLARLLAFYKRRLFEVTPSGEVAGIFHEPIPAILCTLADVKAHLAAGLPGCSLCGHVLQPGVPLRDAQGRRTACPACGGYVERKSIDVYESGGPTRAKPGRQWLTRQPLPWASSPHVILRQWERPIHLCEVSPIEWPPGTGYLTYSWPLLIEGEEAIFNGLADLWRQRRPLCERCQSHGLRGCRHVWRRGLLPSKRELSEEVMKLKHRLRAEVDASTSQRLQSVGRREVLAAPGPDGCYCFTGCAPCSFCCPRQDQPA